MSKHDWVNRWRGGPLWLLIGCLWAAFGTLSGCASPSIEKPGTIHLRFSVLSAREESELAERLARAFEARHPNIKIAIEPVAQTGYDTKLTMQSVAGTLPDVVFLADYLVPVFTHYHIVKDLWPFIKSDPSFPVEDIYPPMLETGMSPDRRLVMLPRELGVVVIFFNRTLFQKAGLPDPPSDWTYDDFLRMAKRLTVRDSTGHVVQYGFKGSYNWPGLFGPMIVGEGGHLLSADRTHSQLHDPASVRGLHELIDLVILHKVAPPPDATLSAQGIDPFVAGRVAMQPGVFPSVPQFRATMKQFDWDVQMMPKGRLRRVVTMGAAGYGIAESTHHPQEAWEFLRFILSPDGQRILAKAGSGIPALRSLAHDSSWRNSTQAPHNLDAFVNSVPYGMPWQDALVFADPEVGDVVNEAFDRSLLGQASVEAAFAEADARVDLVLRKQRER